MPARRRKKHVSFIRKLETTDSKVSESESEQEFSAGEYDIGRTGLIRRRIGTPGARPRRQTLRRTSPEQRAEIERQVKELKERDLIRPSDSAWAGQVVLVGKKMVASGSV